MAGGGLERCEGRKYSNTGGEGLTAWLSATNDLLLTHQLCPVVLPSVLIPALICTYSVRHSSLGFFTKGQTQYYPSFTFAFVVWVTVKFQGIFEICPSVCNVSCSQRLVCSHEAIVSVLSFKTL
jgi:hypothetical protein